MSIVIFPAGEEEKLENAGLVWEEFVGPAWEWEVGKAKAMYGEGWLLR